jgi:hypothetical protein
MGEVDRAHDRRVGRDVAVKIVPPAVAADAAALSRFELEARAVAMLSHPNIVARYEFGASDGMTYAVMELLEGESLRSRLGWGPLTPRKAIEIAAQIARGLAAAHDKHIAHRDLKPENVFIASDGNVKILDFGLARQTSEPPSGTDAPTYSSYLRKAGAEPVLLGEGQPAGVSRDGRWLLAMPVSGSPVLLHPTGAGQTKKLPNPDNRVVDATAWLPDSRQVVMFGQVQGGMSRGYVQNIDGGPPRPFTPEGVRSARWWLLPVSPDGTRVVAVGKDGRQAVMRVSDGESTSTSIPGLQDGELIVQWFADGRGVLAARGAGQPWQVDRLDLATGQPTRALEVRAPDGAGLRLSVLAVTPDARHYVHSYSRLLSDLFLVQGVR